MMVTFLPWRHGTGAQAREVGWSDRTPPADNRIERRFKIHERRAPAVPPFQAGQASEKKEAHMRLKLLGGAAVLALAAVGVALVVAQLTQEDSAGGRVVVIGDALEVSPSADWLVVTTFGESADSGVQELTFTNNHSVDAQVTKLSRVDQDPPAPNDFDGTMTLQIGKKDPITGCPDPLPYTLSIPGSRALGWTVPANGSVTACGKMLYDGLGPADGEVALTFVFEALVP